MVAPLIAGASKAARSAAQGGRKTAAAVQRPELLRKVRARERRKERLQEPLTVQEKEAQTQRSKIFLKRARALRDVLPENGATEQIITIAATSFIAWTVLPFYPIQFIFWLFGLIGIATEGAPVANLVLPGSELFMLSYIMIALIGMVTMLYAAGMYTMRGVRCFSGMRGLAFICSLTGYLVFFVNLFPWVVLWMLAILYTKNDAAE